MTILEAGLEPGRHAPAAQLANVLRDAREGGKLSVRQLAERSGVAARTCYESEEAKRFPSEAVTRAYAEALGRADLLQLREELRPRDRVVRASAAGGRLISLLSQESVSSPPLALPSEQGMRRAEGKPTFKEVLVASTPPESFELAIAMLEHAAAMQPSTRPIIVTLPVRSEGFEHESWLNALKKALGAGWSIVSIQTVGNSAKERAEHVCDALELSQASSACYDPRLLDRGDEGSSLHYVVVPDVGVLQLCSRFLPKMIDSGLFLPVGASESGSLSESLRTYADSLVCHVARLTTAAQPIVTSFPRLEGNAARTFRTDQTAFLRAAERTEQLPGIRYLMRRGLSMQTAPPQMQASIGAQLLKKWGVSHRTEIQEICQSLDQRRSAFLSNLASHPARDICSIESVKAYLSGRLPARPNYWDFIQPDRFTAFEHVRQVIWFLTQYPNYELALVDSDAFPSIKGASWMVKTGSEGSGSVVFESLRRRARARDFELDGTIGDPMVVRSFGEYFQGVWEGLPEAARDREKVIKTLKKELELARQDIEAVN